MKLLTIHFAILMSLILTACGGATETKKAENEQKTTPAVANSTTPAQLNSTVANTKKADADDKPANKQVSNSNSQNSKKTDADDLKKKPDADDKNRNRSSDSDGDDDDN